ncbi:MAG: ClpP class periplasmic serine protease [Mucilaginibacter sp.]|nr:ClpP class periplasmic serine protease [Mucilaginibacter sp.]
MDFRTLSAILRGGWLIDKSYVHTHLPLIANIINGKGNGAELFSGTAEFEKPFVVKDGKKIPAYTSVWNRELCQFEEVFNEKLFADGSVGVIPIIGPVMKYNGSCGEPGMVSRSGWLYDFSNSDKVAKLCFFMDTPGGQCDGTPQYAELISEANKPTTAFVSGSAYSAGAWIASACDEIILADKYAGMGSVGVYQTYMDFSKYLKKLGVKVKDIYAEQSTEKNLAYRKAEDGDFTLIKEGVTNIAGHFIDAFSNNLSGKLKNDSWKTGAVFTGQEIIDIGMADRIAPFEQAIALNKKVQISVPALKSSSNSNQNHMKFPKTAALAGVENPTDEQLAVANAELGEAGITGLVLVSESIVTDAANVTSANHTLTGELATANESLTEANGNVTKLTNEVTTLKAKIAAGPAAVAPAVGAVDPVNEESPEAAGAKVIAGLAHNQGIANNPLFIK